MRGEVLLRDLFDSFGVAAYHARGVRGQGVKILIIDTGMEARTHEAHDSGAEPNVHGFAVRCLIKAPPNDRGLVGIAPEADVTLVDVYDPTAIPIDLLLHAMRKGIDDGVDIMSISLGTNDAYAPLQTVIDEAADKGVLVFAAAGNSGSRAYEYPASCYKAIGVGSVNVARQPSGFNTRNDAVAVFAPGERLQLPTGPKGELQEYNGTSFATPWAAGMAALVLSAKRMQNKGVRMTRREMIDTLRNPQHLDLNCDVHTYVMDRTCTNYESKVTTVEVQEKGSSRAVNIGVSVLLAVFLLMLFWIRPSFEGL